MGKWMDLAARLEAASDSGDNRDKRDNSPPNVSIVPIVPNVPQKLPQDIRAGLITLKSMAAPRLIRPEAWPVAVSDARGLAQAGWALKAMSLGWDVLDLYGAVTDRDGYADADGLAVWLAGRQVLAICETHASVSNGPGWAFFNRCNRLGKTLLWEAGR